MHKLCEITPVLSSFPAIFVFVLEFVSESVKRRLQCFRTACVWSSVRMCARGPAYYYLTCKSLFWPYSVCVSWSPTPRPPPHPHYTSSLSFSLSVFLSFSFCPHNSLSFYIPPHLTTIIDASLFDLCYNEPRTFRTLLALHLINSFSWTRMFPR